MLSLLMRPFLCAGFCLFVATSCAANCVQSSGEGFSLKGAIAVQHATGLEWQRCAIGMTWSENSGNCLGTPTGLSVEQAIEAAHDIGQGWRVPTAPEMDGLFAETCSGAKIDRLVFPGIDKSDFGEGSEFWTTTLVLPPNMYYYFNLTHGYADMHSSGFHLSALLVRKP